MHGVELQRRRVQYTAPLNGNVQAAIFLVLICIHSITNWVMLNRSPRVIVLLPAQHPQMVSAARKIYTPCVVGFYIFKPKSLMLLTEVCLRKLSNFSVRRSCPSLVLLNIIHQLHRTTMTMTLIWLHCSIEPKFWRDEVNLTLFRC